MCMCVCVGGGGVTDALYAPPSHLCLCSHRCHSKNSLLAFHSRREHGSWTFTSFRQQHRPQTQPWAAVGPRTQTRSSKAARTVDSNMNAGGLQAAQISIVLSPSPTRGVAGQQGPRTSTRLPVAAQSMDFCVAFGGSVGHGHQHRPGLQCAFEYSSHVLTASENSEGWGHSSVEQHLLCMFESLGSSPNSAKQQKTNKSPSQNK